MVGRHHPNLAHPNFHHPPYQGLLKDGLLLATGFHGSFAKDFFSFKISSSCSDLFCDGSIGFACEKSAIIIVSLIIKSKKIYEVAIVKQYFLYFFSLYDNLDLYAFIIDLDNRLSINHLDKKILFINTPIPMQKRI